MKFTTAIGAAALALATNASAQQTYSYGNATHTILRVDNGTYGPPIEEVHYYYQQWPIGLSVASDGRIFTCYTRGTYPFTLGVVVNKTAEAAFPSSGPIVNLPPSQLNTSYNGIPFGPANKTGFVSVQALFITPATSNRPETLWVLDTGRPSIMNDKGESVMPYAQPGGPKIVAFNVTKGNSTAYRTYTFPADVHYPDSYMNDLRFDLRRNVSGTNGSGIVYIVDSSDEGRNGFIMLDLGTGESWRRLDQDPSVLRVNWAVPAYIGLPTYFRSKDKPVNTLREGLDGVQLSPDGKTIYYSPLTSNSLYSVPSANLRARDSDPLAELAAHGNISHHGQRGGEANGFEGDTDGRVYQLMPTQNSIFYFDPRDLQTHPFVRDPRILWPDSASVGFDGYIYININQLYFQPAWNDGVNLRDYPGAILRAKLPGNATKIRTLGD